jgi:hypothetical protein
MKIKYKDGEPCSHKGCLSHISHLCEGCGRIGGKGVIYELSIADCEKFIVDLMKVDKSR